MSRIHGQRGEMAFFQLILIIHPSPGFGNVGRTEEIASVHS